MWLTTKGPVFTLATMLCGYWSQFFFFHMHSVQFRKPSREAEKPSSKYTRYKAEKVSLTTEMTLIKCYIARNRDSPQ